MDLEKNNLDAQISLMKDILSNYRNITYHVTEKGKELLGILKKRTYSEDSKTVTFSKEDFDKMFDIASILSEEGKHEQLGILAKKAVPDNETKIKILNILQKGK